MHYNVQDLIQVNRCNAHGLDIVFDLKIKYNYSVKIILFFSIIIIIILT